MSSLVWAPLLASCLATLAQAQDNTYVEIPIAGTFGEEITPRGLENALKAAAALGAKHVVFTIDSKGGDVVVARDFVNALRKHDGTFQFHALVREAAGVAVAVVAACDTVFIHPCGTVGGNPGVKANVVLSNLALGAGEDARRHGRSAELVRAMMDPSEEVYAFKDAAGGVRVTRDLPSVLKGDFLLEHWCGQALTLDAALALELGFARVYGGDPCGLGSELGLAGWAPKGDVGRRAMTEAAEAERLRHAVMRYDRRQFQIEQNRRRREATKASIERFLALANQWHPKNETYSTYKEWGWHWDRWMYDTGRLTAEARLKWRDRTDVTAAALSKARGGVLEMKELEKEAKALGQDPFYPEGKLEEMRLDLELKIALLVREREKWFRDPK